MEIDKKLAERLANTDDALLREQLTQLAAAMGIEGRKAELFLSDMPALKRKISRVTDEELKTITEKIGEEKLEEIKNASRGIIKAEDKKE